MVHGLPTWHLVIHDLRETSLHLPLCTIHSYCRAHCIIAKFLILTLPKLMEISRGNLQSNDLLLLPSWQQDRANSYVDRSPHELCVLHEEMHREVCAMHEECIARFAHCMRNALGGWHDWESAYTTKRVCWIARIDAQTQHENTSITEKIVTLFTYLR